MQTLSFNPVYRQDLLRGTKTTTVRWNERLNLGPAAVVFDDDPTRRYPATILRLSQHQSDQLTVADVGAEQDANMQAFVEQLRQNYYPAMPKVATLTLVHFEVVVNHDQSPG